MSYFPFVLFHATGLLAIAVCAVAAGAMAARHRGAGYGLALAGFILLFVQASLGLVAGLLPPVLAGAMPMARLGAVLAGFGVSGQVLGMVGLFLILAALFRLRPGSGAATPGAAGDTSAGLAAAGPETGSSSNAEQASQAPPEGTALAGIAHLGIFLNLLGIILTLVIYLMQTDRGSFTARHAKQVLAYQIAVHLLAFAGGLLLVLPSMWVLTAGMAPRAGMLAAGFLIAAVSLSIALYGLFMAILAFSGREVRYAVIGDWVERL